MAQITILIALQNTETSNKIKLLLNDCGQTNIYQVYSSNEMLRGISQFTPDLIIMAFKLQDKSLIGLLDLIDESCDILAIVTQNQRELIGEELGLYLVDLPLSKTLFKNSVNIIVQGRLRKNKLLNKIKELELTLSERKQIEKAKGILMKTLGISEEEAFKLIQKRSMNKCCKMVELSIEIISKGGI